MFDAVLGRMNKMEEKQAEIIAQQKMLLDVQADASDDDDMQKKKEMLAVKTGDGGVDAEALNQLRMKMDSQEKKLQELIQNM